MELQNQSLYKPPCARITGQNILFYMRKNRITIGRRSHGSVDIVVGDSPCVSRKHLEIINISRNLYIKCMGKNGIFVNEEFQAYTLEPVKLPRSCELRFPSTAISLSVESLDTLNSAECYNPKKRVLASVVTPLHGKDEETLSESSSDAEQPRRRYPSGSLMPPRRPSNYDSQSASREGSLGPPSDLEAEGDVSGSRDDVDYGTSTRKPPYSYAQMIIQAIVSAPDRRLTLSGIYDHISKFFVYYKPKDKGWQNSIRHNLSLNRYFIRVPRAQDDPGKGSLWCIEPSCEAHMASMAFRKRRSRGGGSGLLPGVSGQKGVRDNRFHCLPAQRMYQPGGSSSAHYHEDTYNRKEINLPPGALDAHQSSASNMRDCMLPPRPDEHDHPHREDSEEDAYITEGAPLMINPLDSWTNNMEELDHDDSHQYEGTSKGSPRVKRSKADESLQQSYWPEPEHSDRFYCQ